MCLNEFLCFFFFKQKTAYEMRISDWSSDVCSSDLRNIERRCRPADDRADRALRVGGGIMDVDAISPRREQRRPGAADQSCANAGHRFRYRLRRGRSEERRVGKE